MVKVVDPADPKRLPMVATQDVQTVILEALKNQGLNYVFEAPNEKVALLVRLIGGKLTKREIQTAVGLAEGRWKQGNGIFIDFLAWNLIDTYIYARGPRV